MAPKYEKGHMRVQREAISYSPRSLCVCVSVCRAFFWSTHLQQLLRPTLRASAWDSTRVLGVSPKGSVGMAYVCWACLKIGRESVCLQRPTAILVATDTTHNHHHHHRRRHHRHRRHHHHHLPLRLLLKVLIAARVFFKRQNPGAVEEGAEGGAYLNIVICQLRTHAKPPISTLTSRATHAHPTSPRSTGFCAIWGCISSSSSSSSEPTPNTRVSSRLPLGEDAREGLCAGRGEGRVGRREGRGLN